jgi:hypothetical protein
MARFYLPLLSPTGMGKKLYRLRGRRSCKWRRKMMINPVIKRGVKGYPAICLDMLNNLLVRIAARESGWEGKIGFLQERGMKIRA